MLTLGPLGPCLCLLAGVACPGGSGGLQDGGGKATRCSGVVRSAFEQFHCVGASARQAHSCVQGRHRTCSGGGSAAAGRGGVARPAAREGWARRTLGSSHIGLAAQAGQQRTRRAGPASAHPWAPRCRTSRRRAPRPGGCPRQSRRTAARRTRIARLSRPRTGPRPPARPPWPERALGWRRAAAVVVWRAGAGWQRLGRQVRCWWARREGVRIKMRQLTANSRDAGDRQHAAAECAQADQQPCRTPPSLLPWS